MRQWPSVDNWLFAVTENIFSEIDSSDGLRLLQQWMGHYQSGHMTLSQRLLSKMQSPDYYKVTRVSLEVSALNGKITYHCCLIHGIGQFGLLPSHIHSASDNIVLFCFILCFPGGIQHHMDFMILCPVPGKEDCFGIWREQRHCFQGPELSSPDHSRLVWFDPGVTVVFASYI